jgi:hypothetical protein
MIPRERPRRRQRAGGVSAVGLVVRWQDSQVLGVVALGPMVTQDTPVFLLGRQCQWSTKLIASRRTTRC